MTSKHTCPWPPTQIQVIVTAQAQHQDDNKSKDKNTAIRAVAHGREPKIVTSHRAQMDGQGRERKKKIAARG